MPEGVASASEDVAITSESVSPTSKCANRISRWNVFFLFFVVHDLNCFPSTSEGVGQTSESVASASKCAEGTCFSGLDCF